ncbi:hypothetical protein Vadar_023172 [Vaccinium darrowii]|uniref:Uncharacterized protein n=1 Tax=Vaccinium darrowii TaxID=229202 RepID=A0ACB7ZNG6_9ERIC|nr:hypothetical protein Vadar_023172 [Vaccinium darrowii]
MPIPLFLKALIISTFLHALLGPVESSVVGAPQSGSDIVANLIPLPQNQSLTSDAQAYLDAHNAIRRAKGVPPLQWDPKLAQYAKNWADQSVNECNPHHHSGGPYGENTLWEQYDERTPAMVAQIWINEQANYDQSKMQCKCQPETSTCMCGHYTQVVWSSTTAVGCGNATCNNDLGVLIVCSYNPPGNYVNQNPFQNAHPLPSTGLPGPSGAKKLRRNRRHGTKMLHRLRNASKPILP